jgi:uncharacterized protein
MSPSNRRQFLTRAAALSCGALCNNMLIAHPHPAPAAPRPPNEQLSGKSLLTKMKWFNEPASAKQSSDQLIVTTKPKTDFWRKTFYDYVTNNGHFFFLPVTGDFTWESRVAGKYSALYDQAGLMVRIDDSNWLKCGLELVDGIGHASVVVTREFSDWSTVRGISTKDPLWWRIVRKGSSPEVLYAAAGTSSPRGLLISLCKPPWTPELCAARPKAPASKPRSTKSV